MSVNFVPGDSEYYNGSAVLTAHPISVSMWVYLDTVAINQVLWSLNDLSDSLHFARLQIFSDANLYAGQRTAGSSYNEAAGPSTISDSTWTHIGAKFNTTSRTAYVDGSPGTADTGTTDAPTAADDTAIGALTAGGSASLFADGAIAEVGVWDIELSDAEFAELAAGKRPSSVQAGNLVSYCDMLVANDPLDENVGAFTYDANGDPNTWAGHPPMVAELEQEGYRFRNDDGSESAATWKAAQDTDVILTAEESFRLRVLVNAAGNPDAGQVQLEVKKTSESDTAYVKII